MRTLRDLVGRGEAKAMSEEDIQWLRILTSDWQVVADLAAADLVLWLPTDDDRFVAAGLSRSATSATLHVDDVIGLYAPTGRAAQLCKAYRTGKIVAQKGTQWAGLYSSTSSYIPVVREGRTIAVISRETNLSAASRQGGGQSWSVLIADILCEMIAEGAYPDPAAPVSSAHGVPRVVDGTILLDAEGAVLEVSPNANSSMKRLGITQDLVGRSLIEDVTEVMRDEERIEETMAVVVMGRAPWRVDLGARGTTVAVRAIPLKRGGERIGAVLLTRDVTEMRKHEQQLMTKDAIIREIHHRVKNNLQTVSALLRIQERRSDSEQVQDALREAGRRVESIATVHDALAQNVDEVVEFDEVASSILQMAARVASARANVDLDISGSFGRIVADQASALATVLAELVSNSVEHGTPEVGGTIWIHAERRLDVLTITVRDQGINDQPPSMGSGLGTQIVKAMVRGELAGTINWEGTDTGGTEAILKFAPRMERNETS